MKLYGALDLAFAALYAWFGFVFTPGRSTAFNLGARRSSACCSPAAASACSLGARWGRPLAVVACGLLLALRRRRHRACSVASSAYLRGIYGPLGQGMAMMTLARRGAGPRGLRALAAVPAALLRAAAAAMRRTGSSPSPSRAGVVLARRRGRVYRTPSFVAAHARRSAPPSSRALRARRARRRRPTRIARRRHLRPSLRPRRAPRGAASRSTWSSRARPSSTALARRCSRCRSSPASTASASTSAAARPSSCPTISCAPTRSPATRRCSAMDFELGARNRDAIDRLLAKQLALDEAPSRRAASATSASAPTLHRVGRSHARVLPVMRGNTPGPRLSQRGAARRRHRRRPLPPAPPLRRRPLRLRVHAGHRRRRSLRPRLLAAAPRRRHLLPGAALRRHARRRLPRRRRARARASRPRASPSACDRPARSCVANRETASADLGVAAMALLAVVEYEAATGDRDAAAVGAPPRRLPPLHAEARRRLLPPVRPRRRSAATRRPSCSTSRGEAAFALAKLTALARPRRPRLRAATPAPSIARSTT